MHAFISANKERSVLHFREQSAVALFKLFHHGFHQEDIKDAHPNTARVHYYPEDGGEGVMQGASVGGGNILVNQIDGLKVEFNGENSTILVMHRDKPGVIAAVTQLMHWEYAELNISNFHLARQRKGGDAIMTIEIDGQPPEKLIHAIRNIEHVTNAILVRRI